MAIKNKSFWASFSETVFTSHQILLVAQSQLMISCKMLVTELEPPFCNIRSKTWKIWSFSCASLIFDPSLDTPNMSGLHTNCTTCDTLFSSFIRFENGTHSSSSATFGFLLMFIRSCHTSLKLIFYRLKFLVPLLKDVVRSEEKSALLVVYSCENSSSCSF